LTADSPRTTGSVTIGPAKFKFAPVLAATVITFLLLWLFKTVAHVFVLLMLAVLVSLYLGAVADWLDRRTTLSKRMALAIAIIGSLGGLVLLAWILVPPIVEQTRQLFLALPDFMNAWEVGIDRVAAKLPGVSDIVGKPVEHKALFAAYDQLSGLFSGIPTKLFEVVEAAINIFAVLVMSIYLSVHPALYREWLIALFPPIHRDLVRDVLAELADSLRAYIVGQLLTMTFLGLITGLGLALLGVPFAFLFGIFTGLVAIVPFFGTLLSTTLPALFVLNGKGYFGFSPVGHALLVVGLGVVVHLIEGNLVSPLVMSKKVDLPPVMTIMSVLIMGSLLGGLGLVVALPTLAALMVIVRRIVISRIYEGQGFRRTTRERPMLLRVPGPGGGVLAPSGPAPDIVTFAESEGRRQSA
jgi:predicted PurR-regulated permease PerM